MKITRIVNGQNMEFELTSDEIYLAYLEQEHKFDCMDIVSLIDSYNLNVSTREEFFKIYSVPFDKVFGNDELINELAYEKRNNQDKFGMEWDPARDKAFKDVLAEHRLELIGLPERCYGLLPSTGEIIIIARGESGYYETGIATPANKQFKMELVEAHNQKLGVTKAQAEAMLAGSMFGWDVPGADPKNYDENGKFTLRESEEKQTEECPKSILTQIVDYIVDTACTNTATGEWSIYAEDVCAALEITENEYWGVLDQVVLELGKRDEIVDLDYVDNGNFDLRLDLDYCKKFEGRIFEYNNGELKRKPSLSDRIDDAAGRVESGNTPGNVEPER